MISRRLALLVGVIAVVVACGSSQGARSGEVPRMSKEELKSLLGQPDVFVLDVRTGGDWEASDRKIAGAIREDPRDASAWAAKYPKDSTIVLYCS
jgi:hypothetical protein